MASLQARTVHGHKYWYLVESRRVNGKPRPVVLAYLGKADDLLDKLNGTSTSALKVKSYSHGAVAAFLTLIAELDLVGLINRTLLANGGSCQFRDGLTIGASVVLRSLDASVPPAATGLFPPGHDRPAWIISSASLLANSTANISGIRCLPFLKTHWRKSTKPLSKPCFHMSRSA